MGANGFAIIARAGVDATGVKTGIAQAEQAVTQGAKRMEREGGRAGRGIERSAQGVRVNGRKAGAAVSGFAADIATGTDATTAFTGALLTMGRGLKGGLLIAGVVGVAGLLAKKFKGVSDEAKSVDKQMKKLVKSGVDLKSLSREDLFKNLKAQREIAESKGQGGIIGKIKSFFDPSRSGEAKAATAGAANTFSAIQGQLQGQNKVDSLKVRGHSRRAQRAEFDVKEARDRADLQQKLDEGKANDNEKAAALGVFDAGRKNRGRLAGVNVIGGRASKAKVAENGQFSGLDSLSDLKGRGARGVATPLLEGLKELRKKDAPSNEPEPPGIFAPPNAQAIEQHNQVMGTLGISNKDSIGQASGKLTGDIISAGLGGTVGLTLFKTMVTVLKTIAENTNGDGTVKLAK